MTRTRKVPTAEQKAKAEARREAFKALAAEVAKMPDEQRAEFIVKFGSVMNTEGRPLSMVNTILLAMQNPSVSLVGGFNQWLALDRCVKKGERGMSLWIPTGKKTEASETTETSEGGTETQRGFILGTVFDISQTEPKDGTDGEGNMLAAVWENPNDETVILACADWLTEKFGWDRETAETTARQHAKRSLEFQAGSVRLAA